MTTKPLSIAIVGGGLGGPVLARLLQRRGIAATIHELDPAVDSRDQGGMLDLHEESGQRALREIGLHEQFLELVDPEGQAMRVLDKTGTVFVDEGADDGGGTRPEIERTALRNLLVSSLDPGTIVWGHKLAGVTALEGGRHELTFTSGHHTNVDLLVGADGAWSKVRPLLSPARPAYCGISFLDLHLSDVDRRYPASAALLGRGMMFGHGVMSAVADADLDGKPDLVRFDRVAGWDTATSDWVTKSWFVPNAAAQKPGHVAIADLGQYSLIPGMPAPNKLPEIVVVSAQSTTFAPTSTGTIRVQALDGSVVWGPVELYHDPGIAGGHGGPPTASDFDGDGQVEFAAAANQYYAVYDPDCVAALGGASPPQRPGGKCDRAPAMAGLPDGVLWAQLSQDFSSSGTGSSVFDFNGDGNAEAVYGDECYVRVYEGKTGEVIFSAPASNATGFELPVIADVDGDFATEIVVSRSPGPTCPAQDPLFPASGNFAEAGGFMILRDPKDAWASSRPIWNQHAYSITNVSDDARIPKASEVKPNWTQPGLNNFRQNTQGALGLLNIADLTAVFSDVGMLCGGEAGDATLQAKVCNRGTNPVQDGVTVEFRAELAGGDTSICTAATTKLLLPGDCEVVSCTGFVPATENVYVVVDPAGTIADCHPGNNNGAGTLQLCPH